MSTDSILSWDYLAQSVPGFGELEYLRKALGEEFPLRASRMHPPSRNPLLASLLFPLTGAVEGLKTWSIGLRALSGSPGLSEVLADLESIHHSKPSHAFYLIDAVGSLCRKGVKVLFEPPPDLLTLKRADAVLEDSGTGERVYFELSVQELSEKQSGGLYLSPLLFPPNAFPDVHCAARFLKTPTEIERHIIEEKIEAGIRAARENRTLVEISEMGILDMAACHRDQPTKLDDWREKRGFSGSCFGQGLLGKTDEILRLKHKIQKEQTQLPEGYANILLIQSDSIFNRVPVRTLISELSEPIMLRGHLGAVIIRGGNFGEATALSLETETCRFERRIEEGRFDHTLLIWNPSAKVRPTASLTAALLRACFNDE